MAPPPQGQMRPSRYLFTLAAIFIVLFGVVIGFGSGSLKQRLEPKLGLDLVGGTTMGQWLSAPMILLGIIFVLSRRPAR